MIKIGIISYDLTRHLIAFVEGGVQVQHIKLQNKA